MAQQGHLSSIPPFKPVGTSVSSTTPPPLIDPINSTTWPESSGSNRVEAIASPLGSTFWGLMVFLPLIISQVFQWFNPGTVAQYYFDIGLLLYMLVACGCVWQASEYSHAMWKCLARAAAIGCAIIMITCIPAFDVSLPNQGFALPTPANIKAHFAVAEYYHPLGKVIDYWTWWQGIQQNLTLAKEIQSWATNALLICSSLAALSVALHFGRRN